MRPPPGTKVATPEIRIRKFIFCVVLEPCTRSSGRQALVQWTKEACSEVKMRKRAIHNVSISPSAGVSA